jgi:hypothetical protein
MNIKYRSISLLVLIFSLLLFSSCRKIKNIFNDNPDLLVLEQGFKSSIAMGYCASVVHSVFNHNTLPYNVTFTSKSTSEFSNAGLIYIKTTALKPLPFNKQIGDIVIAAIWDYEEQSGVMSVVFGDVDFLNAEFNFYGIHTVPLITEEGTGDIITVYAKQDIIIGEGSDTLLNLNFSRPQFNLETERAGNTPPSDMFAAVKQNVWFVKVDQNDTFSDIYDDDYVISGGGQLAEVSDNSGGIQYHALIESKFNYLQCKKNPYSGYGFIQNIKAGDNMG